MCKPGALGVGGFPGALDGARGFPEALSRGWGWCDFHPWPSWSPYVQVTLLGSDLLGFLPGPLGRGLQVALLPETRAEQPASHVLQGGVQARARAGQVGLDSAVLLAQHCSWGRGESRPSPLGLAHRHPLAMSTDQANRQALQESLLW